MFVHEVKKSKILALFDRIGQCYTLSSRTLQKNLFCEFRLYDYRLQLKCSVRERGRCNKRLSGRVKVISWHRARQPPPTHLSPPSKGEIRDNIEEQRTIENPRGMLKRAISCQFFFSVGLVCVIVMPICEMPVGDSGRCRAKVGLKQTQR